MARQYERHTLKRFPAICSHLDKSTQYKTVCIIRCWVHIIRTTGARVFLRSASFGRTIFHPFLPNWTPGFATWSWTSTTTGRLAGDVRLAARKCATTNNWRHRPEKAGFQVSMSSLTGGWGVHTRRRSLRCFLAKRARYSCTLTQPTTQQVERRRRTGVRRKVTLRVVRALLTRSSNEEQHGRSTY